MAQQNSQSTEDHRLGSKRYSKDATVVPKTARNTEGTQIITLQQKQVRGAQCTRNFKTVFELGSLGWGLTFTKDVLDELRFQYWEQPSRTVSI